MTVSEEWGVLSLGSLKSVPELWNQKKSKTFQNEMSQSIYNWRESTFCVYILSLRLLSWADCKVKANDGFRCERSLFISSFNPPPRPHQKIHSNLPSFETVLRFLKSFELKVKVKVNFAFPFPSMSAANSWNLERFSSEVKLLYFFVGQHKITSLEKTLARAVVDQSKLGRT